MADFILAHKKVAESEGGYTNNPNDNGNYVDGYLVGTNFGISAPTLKHHLGYRPTRDEMYNLSPKVALLIYKNEYWNKIQGDNIKNQSIAHLLYDSAVNQGYSFTRGAIKKAVNNQNKEYEGLQAQQINKLNQKEFFDDIYKLRYDRYSTGNKLFRKGWISRLEEIKFVNRNKSRLYLFSSIALLTTVSIIIVFKWLK